MFDADKVKRSLKSRGLLKYVGSIDDNPATPGEVVVWINGVGYPVYDIEEAIRLVKRHKENIEDYY